MAGNQDSLLLFQRGWPNTSLQKPHHCPLPYVLLRVFAKVVDSSDLLKRIQEFQLLSDSLFLAGTFSGVPHLTFLHTLVAFPCSQLQKATVCCLMFATRARESPVDREQAAEILPQMSKLTA